MSDIDERMMTRLLIGNLAPAERELMEECLAADPAFFEAVCALEDEMILKWHRGELSDEERQLFAHAYLASPSRRVRVASGRLLIDAIDDWRHADEARWFRWTRVWNWLATPRQVPQFTLAAAVALLVAAVPVALYEMGDAMRRLQLVERENAALRHQIGMSRHLSVVFPLSPAGERGSEATPGANVLRIPRDADEVWLQFEMADPGTPVSDAILETMERTLAATPRPVRFERTAGAALVTLTVAAGELLDGDYVLTLRRRGDGGSSNIVATRTFRVMRD